MNIYRSTLEQIKKDPTLKRNTAHENLVVEGEINKIIPVLENHIKSSNIEKASNWMLYKDLWLQNEDRNLQKIRTRNYTRGSIIMSIDWGTSNIGTEIRYPHPGVVLYDQNEDWVIAVPITGAKLDVNKNPVVHEPFEVLAIKQNRQPKVKNEYWFKKHSVIQVDQIQRLSKYRAINKNSYRIRENLLNEIDNKILEYYIPGKNKLIETLKSVISVKDIELHKAKIEIEKLKQELDRLKNAT